MQSPLPQSQRDVKHRAQQQQQQPPRVRVLRVALFGFDETRGNSLLASSTRLPRATPESPTDAQLAEICLPDGGHTRAHDAVSVVFHGGDGPRTYGYACFANRKHAEEKRGARQAALLLVSNHPGMELFRPFLMDALDLLMSGSTWNHGSDVGFHERALDALREAVEAGFAHPHLDSNRATGGNSNEHAIRLWNREYVVSIPPYVSSGALGGASLKDLVRIFREKTMKIWYAVASERRLVIATPGMSAASACTLVLAVPLLLGDLSRLIVNTLEPYITLAVVDRILNQRTFVAGCNNAVFASKSDWWDVYADAATGGVVEETHTFAIVPTDADGLAASMCISSAGTNTNQRRHLRFIPKVVSESFLGSSSSSLLLAPTNAEIHHVAPIKAGGIEMAFMSRVLHDFEKNSEEWLRRQFHDFTLTLLNRAGRGGPQLGQQQHQQQQNSQHERGNFQPELATVLAGLFPGVSRIQSRFSRFAEQFRQGSLWKAYREEQDALWVSAASSSSSSSSSPVARSSSPLLRVSPLRTMHAHLRSPPKQSTCASAASSSPLASPTTTTTTAVTKPETDSRCFVDVPNAEAEDRSFVLMHPAEGTSSLSPYAIDLFGGKMRRPLGFVSQQPRRKRSQQQQQPLPPSPPSQQPGHLIGPKPLNLRHNHHHHPSAKVHVGPPTPPSANFVLVKPTTTTGVVASAMDRWVKVTPKDGEDAYYWNVLSGETSWSAPCTATAISRNANNATV